MRRLSNKVLCLAAAGLVLAGTATVGSAYAYFTTYVQTSGKIAMELGRTETEIEEQVKDGMKIVQVKNTGEYACYVRVTAFAGSEYTLTYEDGGSGNWFDGGDGYWYYKELLQPGETTESMQIKLPSELFEHVTDEKDLNVIVIQECAPESYDDAGNLLPNGPERFAGAKGN